MREKLHCSHAVVQSHCHRKQERGGGRIEERSSPPGYMDNPPKEDVRKFISYEHCVIIQFTSYSVNLLMYINYVI